MWQSATTGTAGCAKPTGWMRCRVHLLVERCAAPLKPPFDEAARKQAGFAQAELDYLLGIGV